MIDQEQIDFVTDLQDTIADAESKIEYAKGQLSVKKEELKEKHKVKTMKEANIKLNNMENELKQIEEKIILSINEIKKESMEIPNE